MGRSLLEVSEDTTLVDAIFMISILLAPVLADIIFLPS